MKGALEGLGVQSLAWDMGLQVKLAVHADTGAAIGICSSSGIGRVRHFGSWSALGARAYPTGCFHFAQ